MPFGFSCFNCFRGPRPTPETPDGTPGRALVPTDAVSSDCLSPGRLSSSGTPPDKRALSDVEAPDHQNVEQLHDPLPPDIPEDIRQRIRHVNLRKVMECDAQSCEDMLQGMKQVWTERLMGSHLDKIIPAVQNIESFAAGISNIVQGLGMIPQIMWGSFQLILSMVLRYEAAREYIFDCIHKLSTSLPIAKAYAEMYPSDRVHAALRGICVCCVEFVGELFGFLDSSDLRNFSELVWRPVEKRLAEIQKAITVADAEFKQVFEYEHKKFQHDSLQALHTLVNAPSTVQAKVPCRIVRPNENKRFFPRPEISSAIESHLAPGRPKQGSRAFLLHGLGGSGKTQLALSFVYSRWNDFDVILWVTAETANNLAEQFLVAARTLGLAQNENEPSKSVQSTMRRWLQECEYEWLIVFDNVDDASLLQEYLPNSARGSILITSRERDLGNCMVDGSQEVQSLDKDDGASMVLHSLGLKASEPKVRDLALDMSSILGGLPLAIAQMTGYCLQTGSTLDAFIKLYTGHENNASRFHQSATKNYMYLGYEHTLETVFKMSFDKLSSDPLAHAILGILVFLDPDQIPKRLFQPKAAILPEIHELDGIHDELRYNEAVSKLRSHHLLSLNTDSNIANDTNSDNGHGQETSFSIHRLVQKSAFDLLKADPSLFNTTYFWAVRLVYEAFPRQSPLGGPIPNWRACQLYTKHVLRLLKMLNEDDNLRVNCEDGCYRLLTELFCDCGVYLWTRGLYSDAERLSHASIELAEKVLDPHDCLRAQPYTLLGCVYLRSENRARSAHKNLQKALEIRLENMKVQHADTDPPVEVDVQLSNAYSNLGIAAKQLRLYDKAAELHHSSIEIKERYPSSCAGFLLGLSYHNLGKVRRLQGQFEEARSLFLQCVQEMQKVGEDEEMQHRKAVWLCSLGDIEDMLGDVNSARAHLKESLDILKRSVGESLDMGITCQRLGILEFNAEDFEQSLLLFKMAVKIFSQGHLLSNEKLAHSTYWLGLTHAKMGQIPEAMEADKGAAKLYYDITGKTIPQSNDNALEAYDSLVLDD